MHTIETLSLALQEQTELSEALRKQAETLEAELRVARAMEKGNPFYGWATLAIGELAVRDSEAAIELSKKLHIAAATPLAIEAPQALSDHLWPLIDTYADAREEYQRSTARHLAKQQRQNMEDAKDALYRAIVALTSTSQQPPAPADSRAGGNGAAHPDDTAVDRFAKAMKHKMAVSRDKGRGGWDDESQCSMEKLAQMLVDHIAKGDPVDIGNFAMMLHQREAEAVEHHPCNGGAARKALASAALASQASKGAAVGLPRPVAAMENHVAPLGTGESGGHLVGLNSPAQAQATRPNLSHRNHVGSGLRLAEAIAAEQIAAQAQPVADAVMARRLALAEEALAKNGFITVDDVWTIPPENIVYFARANSSSPWHEISAKEYRETQNTRLVWEGELRTLYAPAAAIRALAAKPAE